ncbi:MAG: queuine tRNA-ribosyltransferase, queuine tRNA-ribosyltransferase [Candidatus Peregrinibacteria bacterium GW2011_GWE2_39_6]|nr:MAG: queuine tRNA-ribosyltransferase, queuine tRNA-ribosyltransferase [Candidatus Peregrinibacteria bacterium GW2011_GWF2_39_17]KKR24416.1 MAG: queuine tRNA-ribosyltransferase, queuine tRNA-ribosyltransferase [Candidatus Peregrinibacteria bacterium GW2011_GWE2_39_6]HCW32003.1 tRNA guanosine(34) transglycosylase Tgt [Candidatus Peregrinibacteria bacterium]
MFTFKINHTNDRARLGQYFTPHGIINTPAFIPCGTKGVVKTLEIRDLHDLGVEIMLSNTYHLTIRPGAEAIKKWEGLHRWMGWDKPLLTDSGGFQVFSLNATRKIDDQGVEFKSPLNGTRHYFTPESVMQIQEKLGADIIMAFDECADGNSDKAYAKKAMERTHKWAKQCQKENSKLQKLRALNGQFPQALFPIIQGVIYEDLRIESTKFMADLDLPGIAIGGLSVGEKKEDMYRVLDIIYPHLPNDKIHYLMGVGSPEDLVEGVARGIDLFDCVLPTRLARHGAFWTETGRYNIKNKKFEQELMPLAENCTCSTCKSCSCSYIRHLFMEKEITALRLLSIHNLHFLLTLVHEIRVQIGKGNFENFRQEFHNQFLNLK